MDQRISAITLGVDDVNRSRAFYEKLGWAATKASDENVAFFPMNGFALCLFPTKELAKDAGVDRPGSGFDNITISFNVSTEAQVKRVLQRPRRQAAPSCAMPARCFGAGSPPILPTLTGTTGKLPTIRSGRSMPKAASNCLSSLTLS